MSLLLEALKKAEKAKEEAQRRANGESQTPAPLQLQEAAPPAEAKHVLTRPELPDISRPLEILSDDLTPEAPAGGREQRPPSGVREASQARPQAAAREASQQAERATARKVFEAKFKEPNPRLPFYLTMGALAFAALPVGGLRRPAVVAARARPERCTAGAASASESRLGLFRIPSGQHEQRPHGLRAGIARRSRQPRRAAGARRGRCARRPPRGGRGDLPAPAARPSPRSARPPRPPHPARRS